jgi:8-oxo-dGTP pyrophosphatase MutT (NUDIX family)
MYRLPPPTLQPWRRLRLEPLAAYRIFEVCRVELEDGAGISRGDAFTLRSRDWCNVVAVTPDDRVVLVWQYRFGSDALSLEIPGGVIDPGEAPEEAARRELREETGYEADGLELLLTILPNPAVQDNRCFTFVAHGARSTSATEFDGQEELETVLVPADRIADLLDGGQVTHSLVQGALEKYWRKRTAGSVGDMEQLVVELEELQRRKVIDLARRLRPGVTSEDIRNPHDFPELGDPDWQYEDGVLAGIQSVLAAVRAESSSPRSRVTARRPRSDQGP